MAKVVRLSHFPIPTPQELQHNFWNSDPFTVVDLNHGFHQFPMDVALQDLFMFFTPCGLHKLNMLVMGAHNLVPIYLACSFACILRLLLPWQGSLFSGRVNLDVCCRFVLEQKDIKCVETDPLCMSGFACPIGYKTFIFMHKFSQMGKVNHNEPFLFLKDNVNLTFLFSSEDIFASLFIKKPVVKLFLEQRVCFSLYNEL